MNSRAHIGDEKKELAKELHRLAHLDVRLSDLNKGGVTTQA